MTSKFRDEAMTAPAFVDPSASSPGLTLSIIGEQLVTAHPLPLNGKVIIGRSQQCNVSIDDPSVSRQHAALYTGSELAIEDLGSINGTRIAGRALLPHQRQPVAIGETIEIGSVAIYSEPDRGSQKPWKARCSARRPVRYSDP